MSTPKKEINFTQRDFELLAKAMSCTKEPMTIDYQKFAEAGSFKNSNSAKASWHSIKKKIDALSEGAAMKGGASDNSEAGAPTTPAKASSKKRKSDAVKTEAEDDDENEAETTPAKTPKRARKSSTKAKGKASTVTEEDGEADEAQDMPSDVKSDIKSEVDAAQDGDEGQPTNGDGEAAAGAVKEESTDA